MSASPRFSAATRFAPDLRQGSAFPVVEAFVGHLLRRLPVAHLECAAAGRIAAQPCAGPRVGRCRMLEGQFAVEHRGESQCQIGQRVAIGAWQVDAQCVRVDYLELLRVGQGAGGQLTLRGRQRHAAFERPAHVFCGDGRAVMKACVGAQMEDQCPATVDDFVGLSELAFELRIVVLIHARRNCLAVECDQAVINIRERAKRFAAHAFAMRIQRIRRAFGEHAHHILAFLGKTPACADSCRKLRRSKTFSRMKFRLPHDVIRQNGLLPDKLMRLSTRRSDGSNSVRPCSVAWLSQ
jgi:hypothetical protein